MILFTFFYLDKRYKKDPLLNKSKYLAFLSLVFIYRIDLLLISPIFFAIGFIDLIEYKIPNDLNISLLLVGLFIRFISKQDIFLYQKFELIFMGLFLLVLFLISYKKDLVGFGDVKNFMALSMIKNPHNFINLLFYLSILLFLTSIVILLKTRDKKSKLPLGPIIFISYILNEIF